VPTPFYHLSVAQDLLDHPSLSHSVRQFLRNQQPAFFLGKTAPDVQVVSGQRREETHFYTIPMDRPSPAWQRMLEAWPTLRTAASFPPDQAAFLAGYLCHLQADQRWLVEILLPVFGPDQNWETFQKRLYIHNVLRAYLDRDVIAHLPRGIGRMLQSVNPDHWLPFVDDLDLMAWRDYLAKQLHPGEHIETVEVFAERQGVSAEAIYKLLESEAEMQNRVFNYLPRKQLDIYRQQLIAENVDLLTTYLEPRLTEEAAHWRVEYP
jgi:hypothetical protein